MSRFFRSLRKRPVALISILVLVLLYVMMLFAGPLSPYAPNTTFKNHSYHPPNLALYSKELGLGPQVQQRVLVDQINWEYVRISGQYYRVRLFVRGGSISKFVTVPPALPETVPPNCRSSSVKVRCIVQ